MSTPAILLCEILFFLKYLLDSIVKSGRTWWRAEFLATSRSSFLNALGLPEGRTLTIWKRRLRMSDLILMVRLFIGIFYPKAVEPLQNNPYSHS